MAITETPSPAPTPTPPDPEQHAPGDKEMTLLEHLEELRGRLVGAALGVVAGILVAIIPVPGLGSITEMIVKLLAERAPAGKLSTLGPGEGFFTFLEVAMIIGIALSMPVIVYQVLSFITPALYENERKYLYIAVPGVTRKMGVVSAKRMASFRKYAFVLAFVIGAVITPTPDPINQTIVSLPIYFLFELGVILARFA
ncbi:MAG: twin-arginine translocase subunit TatC [Chloroflexi bacterium]|nr:twin-arginine translocase subunit TatC [Chloroflexota bacterium]